MNSTSSRSPRCVHAGRCSQVQIGSLNDVGWVDRQEDWGMMWKPTVAKKQRIIVRLTGCQWEIFYVKKQKNKNRCTPGVKEESFKHEFNDFIPYTIMHFLTIKYIFFFGFCFFFFLPRLVPGIVAFVVIGLIPLSAPASWTHCVSFCSPQEGRTGASVFGLAMSKSALLVPTQDGCTCLSLSLFLSEKRETQPRLSAWRDCSRTQTLSCVDAGPWWLSLFSSSPELSVWDHVYQDAAVSQSCFYWYSCKVFLCSQKLHST